MNSETKHVTLVLGELEPQMDALRPIKLGTIKNIQAIPFHIKVALAHKMLYALDKDWPYLLEESSTPDKDVDRGQSAGLDNVQYVPGYCVKCGGLEYVNPVLSPKIINDVVGAVGLKVDIVVMVSGHNCAAAKETFLNIRLSANEAPNEVDARQKSYLLATDKYSNLCTIAGFTELLDECPNDLEFWDTVGVAGNTHYKPVYKTGQ